MKLSMKNSLRSLLLVPALAFVLGLVAVPVAQPVAAGSDLSLNEGVDAAKGEDQAACLFGTEAGCAGDGIFRTITNVLLFLIGAISVIMLIIGGIKYTVSGGDSSAVTSAKNTILYAIVGIIVAVLAFAVVNFVIDSFTT